MGDPTNSRFNWLQQRVKLKAHSLRKLTYWEVVALLLLCVAIVVPHYFIKCGHHPPVGTYIAIMGALAAAVTFRKDPPSLEKAAWIFVITTLMFAEIRNLYVADHEQAQTFTTITDELKLTKQGLDNTAKGLSATANSLRGISGESTGGDSFCYVDVASSGPNQIAVHLLREGRYPLFHVDVVLNDVTSGKKPCSRAI